MAICNVKSLHTSSNEVQNGKRAQRWEALLSEQALCMWLSGCTKLKLFVEVNGGILHHYIYLQPDTGRQISELCTYQSNSDTP